MRRFNKRYFLFTIILLITEILIALFLHDKFVRPYVGDFLVVILIYCFLKTFLYISVIKLAVAVLMFAYFVEMLQYFNLINYIGLQNSRLAKIILGSAFEWSDMLAYTLGVILIVLIEEKVTKKGAATATPII
jgi:hypothetical protein